MSRRALTARYRPGNLGHEDVEDPPGLPSCPTRCRHLVSRGVPPLRPASAARAVRPRRRSQNGGGGGRGGAGPGGRGGCFPPALSLLSAARHGGPAGGGGLLRAGGAGNGAPSPPSLCGAGGRWVARRGHAGLSPGRVPERFPRHRSVEGPHGAGGGRRTKGSARRRPTRWAAAPATVRRGAARAPPRQSASCRGATIGGGAGAQSSCTGRRAVRDADVHGRIP